MAETPPHIRQASREQIIANDLSLASLPRIFGFERFISDLAHKSPIEALEILEARFRENPSVSNGALLQAAINGLTTARWSPRNWRSADTFSAPVFCLAMRRRQCVFHCG